jgi:hypothetical protein
LTDCANVDCAGFGQRGMRCGELHVVDSRKLRARFKPKS